MTMDDEWISLFSTQYQLHFVSYECRGTKIIFLRADGTVFMHVISMVLLSDCSLAAGKSIAHKACLHLP
jgi:hypothetical protein